LWVYLATRWADSGTYASSAYNIYLNYDDNGSKYGDICVKADTSDVEKMPVYASIHKDNQNKLNIILINRTLDKEGNAKIKIQRDYTYTSCTIYGFDYRSPDIKKIGTINNIENNYFELKVPQLTVYHLVF